MESGTNHRAYISEIPGRHPSAVPLTPNVKITLNGQAMKLDQRFGDSAEQTVYHPDIVSLRTRESPDRRHRRLKVLVTETIRRRDPMNCPDKVAARLLCPRAETAAIV